MMPQYIYSDHREVVSELMRLGVTTRSMADYTHEQLAWMLTVMDYLYSNIRTNGKEVAQGFAKHYGLEVEESA